MKTNLMITLTFLVVTKADEEFNTVEDSSGSQETLPPTRRILKGKEVGNTRPYMVYLRPSTSSETKFKETNWLCGGVIIDKRFVLTSAACVEDAKRFEVISGTHTFVSTEETENECVKNGAKRAIWKCVPKSYFFDGNDFDNIRWMVGDIAIVKVEDEFNFERRIRGCDFIPKMIAYNNRSIELEKGGITASIAGWGTTDKYYVDTDYASPLRSARNSVELLETDVVLISKKGCMNRWDKRYHFIINDEMICTKDSYNTDHANTVCRDTDLLCKELDDSANDDYYNDGHNNRASRTQMIIDPTELLVHTAAHQDPSRRRFVDSGGFCENDHGGPLVVGRGKSAVVIGIMSACLTNSMNNKCYGPFLFTSVYKYRNLIACAIQSSNDLSCKHLLRSAKNPIKETYFDWPPYTRESKQLNINPIRQDATHKEKENHVKKAPTTKEPINTSEEITETYYYTREVKKKPTAKPVAKGSKFVPKESKFVNKTNIFHNSVKSLPKKHPDSMQSFLDFLNFDTKKTTESPLRSNIELEDNDRPQKLSIIGMESKYPPKEAQSLFLRKPTTTTDQPYPAIEDIIMRKFFGNE